MAPPRRADNAPAPAPLPHLRVTAATDAAELRRQLDSPQLAAVRAVSLSTEPEAAGGLSWTLQQLPQLEELRLQRSPLPSGLRAFGSGLFQLRVLWLIGCGLETLDGVCALPRLQELYVARNQLTDVSVCSCLDRLQVLDVEDNQLTELTSCMFLRACAELRSLELRGNHACADTEQLRQLSDWLPQLQTLNGQLTAAGERLLRRLQRPAQDTLPPVAAIRRPPAASSSMASLVTGPQESSGRRSPGLSSSSSSRAGTSRTSSRQSTSSGSCSTASAASAASGLPAISCSTSSSLPAIDGSTRSAGEPADPDASGERRGGGVAPTSQIKVNTWMAEVAGRAVLERKMTGECK